MVRYAGDASPSSPSPPPSLPSSTRSLAMALNGVDKELFDQLSALHSDEFAYLHKRLKGTIDEWEKSWWRQGLDLTFEYIVFVAETWFKCLWAFLFFPLTFMDGVAIITLSFAACVVMTVLFLWCILCIFPVVSSLFDWASKSMFNGMSLVNAAYPRIFKDLEKHHVQAAREHLSKPPKQSTFSECRRTRVFNLDAAKVLLQCAALMYERSTKQTRTAARLAAKHKVAPADQVPVNSANAQPGYRIRHVCGENGADLVSAKLKENNAEEDTIREIAMRDLGLQYQSVSELNNLGSAFCALFWDPMDSFIIVSFRGTSPMDLAEWRTDFTFQMSGANQWLNGFGKVHEGFMRKIFPRKIPANCLTPHDTIVEAIGLVATRLLKNRDADTKINVWITGHSLGCALASIVYARLVSEIEEIGPNVCVRDAYLFAAPVLCDVDSAGAFNNRMNHYTTGPKTMWRVTNGRDAVACALPEMGDHSRWSLSPWNLMSFSHLGCEIQMRSAPTRCIVSGNHITPGTSVRIESAFHRVPPEQDRNPTRELLTKLQNIPIIGMLIAHAPGFYWASLMDVGTGDCDWEEDF